MLTANFAKMLASPEMPQRMVARRRNPATIGREPMVDVETPDLPQAPSSVGAAAGHASDGDRPPRIALWHFRYSHFNEKVRWALDHKGLEHTRHALVPGFHVPRMLRMTGQPLTPVVDIDGDVVCDSTAIIAQLDERVPAHPLYPADLTQRQRALALEEWFDEECGSDVRRLFYNAYMKSWRACAFMSTAGKSRATCLSFFLLAPVLYPVIHLNMGLGRARVARAEERLVTFFDKVAAELGPSGYLVGDSFSVADLTAAALLSPIVRPAELADALVDDPPAALLALRDTVSSHPSFAWVETMYARHRHQPKSASARSIVRHESFK